MDLKKKLKAFFTLKRRANDGFTLVELIVVIAILAILGGVAVPAYSGYVAKAELAADEALLHEVNLAFASACAINGEDHYSQPSNTGLTFSGNAVTGIKNAGDSVVDSFGKFFEMSDTEFKQMDTGEIMYKKEVGGFKLAGTVSFSNMSASEKSRNDFTNSIYADEDVMKFSDLLDNVDGIVDWATGKLPEVLNDEDFLKFYDELKGDTTITNEEKAKLNALVLYTAQQSKDINYDEMKSVFTGTGQMSDNTIANKAMQYAVGMAYVRDMNKKLENKEISPSEWTKIDLEKDPSYDLVMEKIAPTIEQEDDNGIVTGNAPNDAFLNWFAANGEATMDGYLGAMDMFDENTENLNADQKNQLLNNGFGSTGSGDENDFLFLINGLLGSTTIS